MVAYCANLILGTYYKKAEKNIHYDIRNVQPAAICTDFEQLQS